MLLKEQALDCCNKVSGLHSKQMMPSLLNTAFLVKSKSLKSGEHRSEAVDTVIGNRQTVRHTHKSGQQPIATITLSEHV